MLLWSAIIDYGEFIVHTNDTDKVPFQSGDGRCHTVASACNKNDGIQLPLGSSDD